MNFNRAFSIAMVCLMVATILTVIGCCPATSHAAGKIVTGSLGIETPLGSPDRPQDDSPQIKLNVNFKNFVGPFNLFGGGLVATKKGLPWCGENRFNVGLELPIGTQGLMAYSYFERRFDVNDNRVVLGARYNFRSGY